LKLKSNKLLKFWPNCLPKSKFQSKPLFIEESFMVNSSGATIPQASRILSVDIFRGLTMLVMIFVNDLSGVKGLPWWTYHMPSDVNGMTYVDVVFPAFLFIVGMAVPLAIKRRLEKGDSPLQLWMHILLRSLGLVVLGLFIASADKLDSQQSRISGGAWAALGFVAAILLWNVYPRSGRQTLYKGLKYGGLVLLIVLFAIFRRKTPDGQTAWLDFSYWEILGLIGRAYLAACILYLPFRKKVWSPVAMLVLLCALNVASRLPWGEVIGQIPYSFWIFENGAHASIVMAGVVASMIFLDSALAKTFRQKALWAAGYSALLFAAGRLLSPFGISKDYGTPTWCLYCAGISTLLFLALYWLADTKQWSGWAALIKPAGSNTLLTYLLPDIFYAVVGAWYFQSLSHGWPGVVRSLLFTIFILSMSGVLTKWKIRMQL
jgi:predicted acyltransferase